MGLFVTVEALRSAYGTGRDLTPRQTRELYHSLLPTWLLEDGQAAQAFSLPDRAQLAIAARRAAKLYARERAVLPAALGSELFDGMRRLLVSGGTFQPGGMTSDEIWQKYAGFVPREGEILPNDVYYTILRKACTSNSQIDALCGVVCGEASAAQLATAEAVGSVV